MRSRHTPWFLDGAVRPARPPYRAPQVFLIELKPITPSASDEMFRQFIDDARATFEHPLRVPRELLFGGK